jgi:hypothetical protein
MICWLPCAQAVSVLRPQPPKEELATTVARPVASRAAVTPGELSSMTLSPRIHTRSGSVALAAGKGVEIDAGVIGPAALDAVGTCSGFAVASWPVPACGGPTVAARSKPTVAPTPMGTIARRRHVAQSARRNGISTR